MLQAFFNIWRVKELRNKLLFTLAMLVIYRIGFFIPLPGVDQGMLKKVMSEQSGGIGSVISYMQIFTGGSLKQSTVFGLGIMPYISASIIFQLLGSVSERLKALKKEGPVGYQKIQEYTRYTTVLLCAVQAVFWLQYIPRIGAVYPAYVHSPIYWVSGVVGLTAGSVFLMWLGEQIDKYGIGNGISLIITAGIIAGMPGAIMSIANDFSLAGGSSKYSIMTVIFLVITFVLVIAGSIIITQGQRRIPIQQAKHTRGRRVFGGQKSYLPLRINHGGVMPIIFASSPMIFPSILLGWLAGAAPQPKIDPVTNAAIPLSGFSSFYTETINFLNGELGQMDGYLHALVYIVLIYFFSYFWTTVQFNPEETATNLRDHGSFIPGLRPGPRTAEYLETVMERITYVGAGFLCVIAIIPTLVSGYFKIDFMVTQFLGGTGLLICVSVMLDFVQRIDAQLMMRNYKGLLGGGEGGSGSRIRPTRG